MFQTGRLSLTLFQTGRLSLTLLKAWRLSLTLFKSWLLSLTYSLSRFGSLSFCIQNILFRFEAEQAELIYFFLSLSLFRYFAISLFRFAHFCFPFRFELKNTLLPTVSIFIRSTSYTKLSPESLAQSMWKCSWPPTQTLERQEQWRPLTFPFSFFNFSFYWQKI